MRQYDRGARFTAGSVLLATLLLGLSGDLAATTEPGPTPQSAVENAWHLAYDLGAYEFTSTVVQRSEPALSLANVGAKPKAESLYIEGGIDRLDERLSLQLWSGDGNAGLETGAIEIKVEDGVATGRISGGAWEPVDDVTALFAPGRDPLGFLQAATNIVPLEPHAMSPQAAPAVTTDRPAEAADLADPGRLELKRYGFRLDGPAFARFVRNQLEDELRSSGELPAGIHLDLAQVYVDMSGEGEIWLRGDGLPVRIEINALMPLGPEEQAAVSLRTDFHGWQVEDSASLPAALQSLPIPAHAVAGVLAAFAAIDPSSLAIATMNILLCGAGLAVAIRHRRSRRLYATVGVLTIVGLVGGPLIQARDVHAFFDKHAATPESQVARDSLSRESVPPSAENQSDGSALATIGSQSAAAPGSWTGLQPEDSLVALQGTGSSTLGGIVDGTDSDGDGLTDFQEDLIGTPKDDADADDDGLSDGVEVNELGTDPNETDSDGDSIPDGLEVAGFAGPGATTWWLDPLEVDTDHDGLPDCSECRVNSAGELDCPDTDGDGTPDAFDLDSDDDGVPDGLDTSPTTAVGNLATGLDDGAFRYSLRDLAANTPTFVDFQLRPLDPDHLWFTTSVLDWPSGDTAGQVQRVRDTTLGTGPHADGDMRLSPFLEIEIPLQSGRYGNLPTLPGAPPITSTTPITAWLDTDATELFGISVRKKDDSSAVLAYVPLTLVREEAGAEPVAFTGRMLYEPPLSTWGALHTAKLLWLLEAKTDACPPMPDNYEPDDVAEADRGRHWCEVDADDDGVPDNWIEVGSTVIHAYYDDWVLTGLSVQENLGLKSAIVHQDPATAPADFFEDYLFAAAQGLDQSFIAGRSDGSGRLDFDEVVQRLDSSQNGATTSDERWAIPADAFLVERNDFPHSGHIGEISAIHIPDVLESTYTPQVSTGIDDPTLLIVREEAFRSVNLDRADLLHPLGGAGVTNGVVQGNGIELETDPSTVPLLKVGSINWIPYRHRGGMWEAYPLDEYWNDKNSDFTSALSSEWTDPADLDAATVIARAYYLALVSGRSQVVEVDGVPSSLPSALSDAALAQRIDLAGGKAVQATITDFLSLTSKLFGKEIFIGQPGGGLFTKYTLLHKTFVSYYTAQYRDGAERLKLWGLDDVDDDPLTPKEVMQALDLLGDNVKNDPHLKALTRAVNASTALGLAGTLLSCFAVTAQIVARFAGADMTLQGVRIAFSAVNLVSSALAFTSSAIQLGVYATSKGLNALGVLKDAVSKTLKITTAAIVFFVITAVVSVGFFAYQIIAGGVGFLSLAFNQLLATLVAEIIVGILLLVIGSIPVIGQILGAIIALIDGAIALVCAIFVDPNTKTFERDYVCGGISGLLKKLIQWLIYDQTPIADLANAGRLNLTNIDVGLSDLELGFATSNSVDVALDVDSALYRSTQDSAFSLLYFWHYDDEHVRDSTIEYELRADLNRIDAGLSLGSQAAVWQPPASGDWADDAVFTARFPVTATLELPAPGINAGLRAFLAEGHVIHVQECFGTPNTPVCYLREDRDTLHVNLGDSLVFDVFPDTVGDFMALTPTSVGGYALAWDSKFPMLQDADGDGLRSKAFGGNDPDDGLPDTDFDGLPDFFEIQLGYDPENADIDGDGLNDAEEHRHGTDPYRRDTDNDGLTDKEEIDGWMFVYGFDGTEPLTMHVSSDPLDPNFDGDDYPDNLERAYGFNPWVPSSGGILEITSEIPPEDRIVRPADGTIPYTVTLENKLRANRALGLLGVEFPAAVAGSTLGLEPFNLPAGASITSNGDVTIDPLAPSQVISLTNVAGAAIVDPRVAAGGRSLWLSLDDMPGSSTFAEASLNNWDVTCSAGAGTCPGVGGDGYVDRAAAFAGDWLDVDATMSDVGMSSQGFTLQAWVELGSPTSHRPVLGVEGTTDYFFLGFRSGRPTIQLGTSTLLQATDPLGPGWHHVTWRHDERSGEYAIFVDGELEAQSTSVSADLDGLADSLLYVGRSRYIDGSTVYEGLFDGKLDEVELFPFPLSDRVIDAVNTDRVFYLKGDVEPVMGVDTTDDSEYENRVRCAVNPNDLVDETCPRVDDGIVDGAYQFEPRSDLIQRLHVGPADNLDLSVNGGAYSIVGWLDTTVAPAFAEGFVMGKGVGGSTYEYPTLQVSTDGSTNMDVRIQHENSGGDVCAYFASTPPSDSGWEHVAITFDGDRFRVFVNSVETPGSYTVDSVPGTPTSCSGITPAPEDEFFVGSLQASDDAFSGAVDELQVYNYGLTPQAVADLYWDTDPLLDMRFDEPPTSTTFADRSANAFTGSCSGSQCPKSGLPGRDRQAVDFDGVDDRLALNADTVDLEMSESSFTVSAWVFRRTAGTWTIVGTDYPSDEGFSLGTDGADSSLSLDGHTLGTTTPIPLGSWQHLVARYDYNASSGLGSLSLFVNGTLIHTDSGRSPLTGALPVYVGGGPSSGSGDGLVDHVQVFRAALSDARVAALASQVPSLNLHLEEFEGATSFVNAADSAAPATCGAPDCPGAGAKGKVFKGLTFDGVDDRVEIPEFGLNQFSVGAWIRPTQLRATSQAFLDKTWFTSIFGVSVPQPLLRLSIEPNSMQVRSSVRHTFLGSCVPVDIVSAESLLPGQWNHVMLTNDGERHVLYINGSTVGTALVSEPACSASVPVHLGSSVDSLVSPFTGGMDEVVVYPSALSDREVADLVTYQSNWFDTSFGHTVIVDNDDPIVQLQPTLSHVALQDAILAIHARDATTKITAVEYRVNSGPWTPATRDGEVWLFDFQPTGAVLHSIQARAFDEAGNVGTYQRNLEVDDSGPQIVLINVDDPSTILPASRNAASDTWDVPIEGQITALGSPLARVGVEIHAPDGTSIAGERPATFAPLPSGNDEFSVAYPFAVRPNGRYTVTVTAADEAGNETRRSKLGRIDGTPPIADVTQPISSTVLVEFGGSTFGTTEETLSQRVGVSGLEVAFRSTGLNDDSGVGHLGGLAIHLPLDEARTDLAGVPTNFFSDASGNGRDASCTVCPEAGQSGRYGNAAIFAAGELIAVPAAGAAVSGGGLTFGAWARFDGAGDSLQPVIAFGQDGATTQLLGRRTATGRVVYVDGPTGEIASAAPVAAGEWHHVVVRIAAGGQATLFVNGTPQATFATSASPLPSDALRLGRAFHAGSEHALSGAIDDAFVYNRALSDTEVRRLYRGYAPVLRLPLDEETIPDGDLVEEASRHAHAATMHLAAGTSSYALTGVVGAGAHDFDGLATHVEVPASPTLDLSEGELTLAAWVLPRTGGPVIGGVADAGDPAFAYPSLAVGATSVTFGFGDGIQLHEHTVGSILEPGEWNHVVVTFDGERADYYVNGLRKASVDSFAGLLPATTTGFDIGRSWEGPGPSDHARYDGALDEVTVYRQALAAPRIAALYQEHWRAAPLDQSGPGVLDAHWGLPIPSSLDGPVEIQNRAVDVNANQGYGSQLSTSWSGYISNVEIRTLVPGGDFGGEDVILRDGDTLCGDYTNIGGFHIPWGATANVLDGCAVTIAADSIVLDGTLDGTASGSSGAETGPAPGADGRQGEGPGGGDGGQHGACSQSPGGAGGGYGGAGGDGGRTLADPPAALGGSTYGSADPPGILAGSGGGSAANDCADVGGLGGSGGAGGAAVSLDAEEIIVGGKILTDGADGSEGTAGVDGAWVSGGGGGSGGGIWLNASCMSLERATLSARGGSGGNATGTYAGPDEQHAVGGGGGGGGRVKLSGGLEPLSVFNAARDGGPAGTTSLAAVESPTAGDDGTFVSDTVPPANGCRRSTDLEVFIERITDPVVQTASDSSSLQGQPLPPGVIVAGEQVAYEITAINHGPDTAVGVTVAVTLPHGMSHVHDTDSCALAGLSPLGGQVLACSLGDLPSGGVTVFQLITRVDPDALRDTPNGTRSLEVVVSISAVTPDDNLENNIDRDTVLAQDLADLRITKIVEPHTGVQAGEQFTYTILVDNLGPSSARNVVITDTVVTSGFINANGCSIAILTDGGAIDEFACNFALSTGVFDLGTFGSNWLNPRSPGDMGRIVVTINATADEGLDLSNTATVTADTPDPDPSNNIATAPLSVSALADLELTAPCTPEPVLAGNPLTCTFDVTNNGPSPAEDVEVAVGIPVWFEIVVVEGRGPGGALAGCTAGAAGDPGAPTRCVFGTLGVGAAGTMTVSLRALPDAVTNAVTDQRIAHIDAIAESSTADADLSNNLGHETVTIEASADLSLQKFLIGSPVAGGIVHYEYQVANAGPSVSRDVTLRDLLPDEVEFVSAFVDSEGGLGGVPLACEIARGSSTLLCPLGDIPPTDGTPILVFVNARLRTDLPSGAPFTNTADVLLTDTPDPNLDNNVDSAAGIAQAQADLGILKSAVPQKVNAGEQVKYTITVDNYGPSDAIDVVVTDTLPAGATYEVDTDSCMAVGQDLTCTRALLPGGGTWTFDIWVIVDAGIPASTTLDNVACVGSDVLDPDPDNNCAEASIFVEQEADLRVVKFVSPHNPVRAGEQFTYTIIVDNLGPSRADNVVITDTLIAGGYVDANGCSIAVRTDGGAIDEFSCNFALSTGVFDLGTFGANWLNPRSPTDMGRVIVTINATADEAMDLSNLTVVTSDAFDPNMQNNIATVAHSVTAVSDLSVTKSAVGEIIVPSCPPGVGGSLTNVTAGMNIVYTITVENNGPSRAENVILYDRMPAGVQILTATPSVGSCSTGTPGDPQDKLECGFGTLADGAGATVTVVAQTDWDLPDGMVLENDAFVVSDSFDDSNADNYDHVITTVNRQADLAVTKTDNPDPVVAGELLEYTVTVTNEGPSIATDVVVTDTLPIGVDFRYIRDPFDAGVVCSLNPIDERTLSCSLPDIVPGDEVVFTIVVLVDPDAPVVLTNQVEVASDTTDPCAANNTFNEDTDAGRDEALYVIKTDDPDPVIAGTELTYDITFGNGGPSTATNTRLEDTLPLGVIFARCEELDPNDQVTCSVVSGDGVTTPQVIRLEQILHNNMVVYTDGGTMDPGEELMFRIVTDVTSGYVLDGRGDTGPGEACESFFTATGYMHYAHNRVDWTSDQDAVFDDECTRVNSLADLELELSIVPPAGAMIFDDGNEAPHGESDADGSQPDGGLPPGPVLPLQVLAECGAVSPGEPVTWRATITNNGPSDAADVRFTAQLPAGVVHDPAVVVVEVDGDLIDTPPFIEIRDDGLITVTLCRLNAGGVVTIDITTVVRMDATGEQRLDAMVMTVVDDRCPDRTGRPTPDPILENNFDSLAIFATASALEVTKTVSFDGTCPGRAGRVPALPGQPVTFCLEITNTGDTYLDQIEVIDVIETRLGTRTIFTDVITSGADPLVPVAPGETVTRTYTIPQLLGEECGIAVNNVSVTGVATNAGRTEFQCVLAAAATDSVRVDVPCAGVDTRLQLPALDNDECETWIQVQNVGEEYTKALLVIWGEAGFCPPQAAGPLKVECSGLLRPGSAWSFAPGLLPTGAVSAMAYSMNAVDRVPSGHGPLLPFADVACDTLFFDVLVDYFAWAAFDEAYRTGQVFEGLDFGAHQGQPLAVTVNRQCPDPTDPNVTVNAAYTGVSTDEEGARDPIFGGFTYYAPLIVANQGGLDTWLWIQNSGIECTSLEIWFKAQDNCLRPILGDVLSLAPGESIHFDPNTMVGPDWQGSAWVRASQPLGVVADIMGANHFSSYKGVPGDVDSLDFSLGTQVNYAPLIYNQQQGWDTLIQVQNLSSTTAAKVKMYYLDRSGGIVQTLVDWICPRGSQTFFLPVIGGIPGNWVGSARVESQEWWSPGDPLVDPPRIQSVVLLEKYDDPARTMRREAMAYNAFTERTLLDWQLGRGDGTDGSAVLAVPLLAKDNRGINSELAITNLVPKPGFTDFVIYLYDQNGLVDRICEKLNEKQVEYIDLSQWGAIAPRWLGSAVISATFWEHDVFDGQGQFVRNYVGLGAVAVERIGGTMSDGDIPGDESKAFEAFPIFDVFLNEGSVACPGP